MQKPAEIIANSPAGVGISSFKHGTGSPTVGKFSMKSKEAKS